MATPTDLGGVIPDQARQYTKDVADVYADAVTALLRIIAELVMRGADAGPARAKLADLLLLRRQAALVAAGVSAQLDDSLVAVLGEAYEWGSAAAADHLREQYDVVDVSKDRDQLRRLSATKASTVHGLGRALARTLRDLPILRAAEDAYRAALVAGVAPATAGVETRRHAAQRALDRLAGQGLGGFVDKAGRRWSLDTYAEMATRTTLGQAATQGTVDRIRQTTPFVQVSDQADECERCRPWEGKVLVVGPIPEKWADVAFDGTLADARSGGLFHPNCTHALSAYIPGLTRRRVGRDGATGYADRQEQRRLERGLRDWKRRQAVASTPQAKALADRKVAEWSQRLTVHTTASNRLRLSAREQISRAR